MSALYLILILAGSCIPFTSGDVYFHNPRGSNNRLNERSAARTNANRLFDSQNNNRGGYNVGDATAQKANNEAQQYQMSYFQSGSESGAVSDLVLEWTNQHGCGGNEETDPHKQNCNVVLQYMCETSSKVASDKSRLRDGTNTDTQNYQRAQNNNANEQNSNNRRNNNVAINKGLHEEWNHYDACQRRERNQGLFTADQNLEGDNGLGYSSALYTRQNPNGNRRGYECPEERDYYPYWHPTPWKDIAVLVSNVSLCSSYQSQSFNIQPYHRCIEYWPSGNLKHFSRWNNQEDCSSNGGTWTLLQNYLEKAPSVTRRNQCLGMSTSSRPYIWGIPHDTEDGRTEECMVGLSAPDCEQAPWTRSNHLGNSRDGEPGRYVWNLPYFPSNDQMKCVIRIRYNISTDDYDPFNTDSSSNNNIETGVSSPVQQNPYINMGLGVSPLRLAINTAQFGRTFQDRSHVFRLTPRPEGATSQRIHNLNVRGKRGNIVQVYPAVEYDFIPNHLEMKDGELVHIQWTGSNSHDNGNPGGDGQTGDAGEGTGGTDRHNMVQVSSRDLNYPLPFESTDIWDRSEIIWIHTGNTGINAADLAINVASSGYYPCLLANTCPAGLRQHSAENKNPKMNNLLNNTPASYSGVLLRITPGVYHYICTRNNNFTNRSQKGTIVVL